MTAGDRYNAVHTGDLPLAKSRKGFGATKTSDLTRKIRSLQAGQWFIVDPALCGDGDDKRRRSRLSRRVGEANKSAVDQKVSRRWRWIVAEPDARKGTRDGDLVVQCFAIES